MKPKTIEDKSYWLKHVEVCKISGLNKHKYCKQQNITYHRFLYWFERLSEKTSCPVVNKKANQFIPIKAVSPNAPKSSEVLCVLELKQGHRLLMHSGSVLAKVLSLLSE